MHCLGGRVGQVQIHTITYSNSVTVPPCKGSTNRSSLKDCQTAKSGLLFRPVHESSKASEYYRLNQVHWYIHEPAAHVVRIGEIEGPLTHVCQLNVVLCVPS